MRAASARAELRGAAAAGAFLSLVPLAGRGGVVAADVARGAWAFPAVGAAVGALAAAVALGASAALTPQAGAVAGAVAGLLATGALHLDGLADTADALGGRSRERALEIMRDHAVGAYGAAAVALDLILRTTLLAALLQGGEALAALVAAGAASRAAVPPLALRVAYARPHPGPGAALSPPRGGAARTALAVAVAAALLVAVLGAVVAAAVFAVAVAVAAACGAACRRRFGGVTGDTLGATVELVELASLVALVALT